MNDEQLFERARAAGASQLDDVLGQYAEDAAQQARVRRLMEADQCADSLLDTTAMHSTEATMDEPNLPRSIGDFEILGELGRGGMGVVFAARQRSLKREVALKVLSSGLGLSSKAILRFRREAEAAGKLHHTNIVPIYTTGEDKGIHFYAMEMIQGPSLDQIIKERQRSETFSNESLAETASRFSQPGTHTPACVSDDSHAIGKQPNHATSPSCSSQTERRQVEKSKDTTSPSFSKRVERRRGEDSSAASSSSEASTSISTTSISTSSGTTYFDEVANMIADVAEALDHAHEHGVIHRDVKPSNLLVGPDGRLSINDFGLARMLEQPGMTVSGEFVGSPLYMSPEQITAGRVQLDHRTDIYSLGATLYELLTHQPPFPGQTRDQVLSQILHKEPPSTRKLNRRVPVDLDTICMKAIDKDPDRRYQTAGKLADDLRKYVNRHAISARRIGWFGQGWKLIQRHPSWFGLVVATVALVGSITWNSISHKRNELEHAKQDAIEYSLRGEYGKLKEAIERATENGASENWLDFMDAQAHLFESEFKESASILERLSLNEEIQIPALSLLAIANLYDGLESEQVRTIKTIKELAGERDLSGTECLYVGLALMWAEPKDSLRFLDEAESNGVRGAVLRLVRTHACGNASLDSNAENDAKSLAALALKTAERAREDLQDSQFALLREFAANLNTMVIHRRHGSDYLPFEQRCEELLAHLSSELGSNNSAIYQYLVESKGPEGALDFIHSLTDGQLVDYLRIVRMFTGIFIPSENRYEYSVDADAARLVHHGEYREPTKQIVHLLAGASQEERQGILISYRNNLGERLARGEFDTLEFSWATAMLLENDPELSADNLVQQNVRKAESCINELRGTYIAEIYQPMLDIRTMSPEETIRRSRHSRRRLSIACFVAGIHALANGKPASEARSYFQICTEEGFPVFYTYAFSLAMVERLNSEEKAFYWCKDY